jgi:tape measure domain-containing protein
MADLSLRIKADFDEAARQFKELADVSEDTRAKMEKFVEGFKSESVDKFIDKQKLTGAAITATKGDLAAMTSQQTAYQKEIERLVKSGLSPESEEIKKLQSEYAKLTEKIELNKSAHEMQEKAVKAAKAALIGIGAVLAAGAVVAIKAAAANEDMVASFVPMMGSVEKATELFKMIQKEAAVTPFEIDKIAASVRTLMPAFGGSAKAANEAFKMIGDTAQGNSEKLESITRAYTQVMLKGKVSMKEINTIAGAGVPIYTELAKSMGVTEAQMMKMSSEGKITSAELTKAFQNMTSEGGIFYKGMETASDTFNMKLLGIKENMGILAGVIGERLLPVAKDIAGAVLNAVQSFTDWIQQGDNFKKTTDILTYGLAGLTAGLVAFLVVTKGAAALQAVATAFKALNAAIAANPIGAIAVLITAVLIPALIYLVKNWDTVQTYISQGVARLEYAFKWFGSVIKEKLSVAFAAIKAAGATLIDFIYGNIIRGVGAMLEVMGKLPFVGEMFGKSSQAVKNLGNAMGDMAAQARANVAETIQAAHEEQQATEQALKDKLNAIDAEAQARRAAIEDRKKQAGEAGEAELAEEQRIEAAKTEVALALFKDRLEKIKKTEAQYQNERINSVTQFLQQRAELESKDFDRQIEYLQEQREYLLTEVAQTAQERIAIEEGLALTISNIQQKQADFERKLLEERLGAFTQFTSGMGQLLELAAEKSREAAIGAKVLASAEAAINSYLAFTKALASIPPPLNYIAAAGVLAAGIAQQIKIIQTPIPSAETGGRFVVPDLSSRVDGVGLRVNPGEKISVTPRGEEGGQIIRQIFNIEKQVIFDLVNRGLKSGEIYEYSPSWNLA